MPAAHDGLRELIHMLSSWNVLLPAIHTVMQTMSCSSQFRELGTNYHWDGETLTKANGFLYQLEYYFLGVFQDTLEVLSYLRSLILKLQMQAIDVIYAYKEIDSVTSALNSMREGSDREFKRIFEETTTLGKQLHAWG